MARGAGIVVMLALAGLGTRCGGTSAPPTRPPRPARTLRIGLLPEQNVFRQFERYEPLGRYLSDRTGFRIELKVQPRYGSLLDALAAAELDGAFFGSFTYALAHARLGVLPVARPVDPLGRSTYFGVILVRADGGIRTVADMKGKRFAFVDPGTTAGYLLPLHYFGEKGIRDFRSYLGETYFAGTHEDVIEDVLERRADVGAAKNTVLERLARRDPRIDRELLALDRSPDVPENGLALRPDLGGVVRDRLRSALLAMSEDPEGREVLERFGAIRFVETRDEEYAPVYRYARDIGLDLSRFQDVGDR